MYFSNLYHLSIIYHLAIFSLPTYLSATCLSPHRFARSVTKVCLTTPKGPSRHVAFLRPASHCSCKHTQGWCRSREDWPRRDTLLLSDIRRFPLLQHDWQSRGIIAHGGIQLSKGLGWLGGGHSEWLLLAVPTLTPW